MGVGSKTIGVGLLALTVGCGDGNSPKSGGDAGPDAGSDGGGEFEPATPEPPALPVLTPCPEGWREVADQQEPDIVVCEPWPAGGYRDDCAVDEAHFPGRPGCERIGTPCPKGNWAEDIPGDATVVYVLAGADPDVADGTQEHPFATVGAALGVAANDMVVAIGKGTYDEVVSVRGRLALWGACVRDTVLSASDPAARSAVVTLGTGGAALRNLRVTGARWGVRTSTVPSPVEVDGVAVDHVTGLGIAAWGDLVARDVVVRDTGPGSIGGRGMDIDLGAHVELERVLFERNRDLGIAVWSNLMARDVVVRETRHREDGGGGPALHISSGGRAEVDHAVFELNRAAAVAVRDDDPGLGTAGELVARDMVIRNTLPIEATGTDGAGMVVFAGASASIERALVERNRMAGLYAEVEGAELSATDVVVRDMLPGEGGRMTVGGPHGRGVHAMLGAHVELVRTALVRSQGVGAGAADEGTEVRATDLLVLDTHPRPDGRDGFGLYVTEGASARLERALVDRSREGAIVVGQAQSSDSATAFDAIDLEVLGTLPRETDGAFGLGMQIDHANVTLERAAFRDNHYHGLVAYEHTDVVATDLVIERTASAVGGPFDPLGTGLVAAFGASIEATAFRLSDNDLCGVQLDEASVDLHMGVVSGNEVGANVQADGYDLSRLQDRVVYRDNVINLDSQVLPVPEPVSSE